VARARRVLALILALGSAALGCKSKATATEPDAPATVSDEPDAVLAGKLHADEVFTLAQPEGTYRAVVYNLPKASAEDSDWRVVFYRRQGSAYVRHGAELNAVNFERPRLVSEPGAPPRLESAERRLGVRFLFAVDAKGADMVPVGSVSEAGGRVGDARP
jgi:hypothetical protein